jgi:hypothetical protein
MIIPNDYDYDYDYYDYYNEYIIQKIKKIYGESIIVTQSIEEEKIKILESDEDYGFFVYFD